MLTRELPRSWFKIGNVDPGDIHERALTAGGWMPNCAAQNLETISIMNPQSYFRSGFDLPGAVKNIAAQSAWPTGTGYHFDRWLNLSEDSPGDSGQQGFWKSIFWTAFSARVYFGALSNQVSPSLNMPIRDFCGLGYWKIWNLERTAQRFQDNFRKFRGRGRPKCDYYCIIFYRCSPEIHASFILLETLESKPRWSRPLSFVIDHSQNWCKFIKFHSQVLSVASEFTHDL